MSWLILCDFLIDQYIKDRDIVTKHNALSGAKLGNISVELREWIMENPTKMMDDSSSSHQPILQTIEETAKVANYRTVYFPLDHPDGVLIQSIISCARRSSAYCYDILTDRTLDKTVLLDSVLVGTQWL